MGEAGGGSVLRFDVEALRDLLHLIRHVEDRARRRVPVQALCTDGTRYVRVGAVQHFARRWFQAGQFIGRTRVLKVVAPSKFVVVQA